MQALVPVAAARTHKRYSRQTRRVFQARAFLAQISSELRNRLLPMLVAAAVRLVMGSKHYAHQEENRGCALGKGVPLRWPRKLVGNCACR